MTQCTDRRTYVTTVIQSLKTEAEAITRAADRLQADQVDGVVDVLATCSGKVILTGVGKSGIVARKIAATLTSTGTLSVYLHPVDALHGDLGVVTANDVVMLLSNSGETDELLSILPCLKVRRVPVIALTGNVRSTLARQADFVLDAAVEREACPLNLAPTTSTTVALAIGDALAMTLMQIKGLTPEAFALNHPAGRLGKRLTLRVRDLMHGESNNPTIACHASWLQVLSQMTQAALGAVNVVDELGRLLGIITDGDLRRLLQKVKPSEFEALTAGSMMTHSPIVVTPDLRAYDALQLMENRPSQISVLPVVDQDHHCLGLIRLHDIVRNGL